MFEKVAKNLSGLLWMALVGGLSCAVAGVAVNHTRLSHYLGSHQNPFSMALLVVAVAAVVGAVKAGLAGFSSEEMSADAVWSAVVRAGLGVLAVLLLVWLASNSWVVSNLTW